MLPRLGDLGGPGRSGPGPVHFWSIFGEKPKKVNLTFLGGVNVLIEGWSFFDPLFWTPFWTGFGRVRPGPVILVILVRNTAFSSYKYGVLEIWPFLGKVVKKGSKNGSKIRTPKKVRKNG